MYQHILVPTDGSELSAKAVQHAIGLAKALGARMTAVYASPEFPVPIILEGVVLEPMSLDDYEDRARELAQRILEGVAKEAERAGVRCEVVHRSTGVPWEAILDTATNVGADVITMASHGRRGLAALLLGSETQRVLIHTELPVIVVR
ncbi:MAG TPA: universal stress protein [Casimicrobiaceae bacterium]|nr:universal stress protein [Casimicrobiaceae bacterium]